MTTRGKRRAIGCLLITACLATGVFAGVGALEVVSWLAGIGSFLIAVLIAVWTWNPHTGDSEQAPQRGDVTQSAVATDNATINQAGRDIDYR